MKPILRWVIRIIGIVATAAVLLWLVQLLLLPWIVRREAAMALESLGLPRATFEVNSITPWGAQLTNVEGHNPLAANASSVTVQYSPTGAVRGKLESVTLTGAELAVRFGGNELTWGLQPASGATQPAAMNPVGEARSLPFEQLRLRASVLRLEVNGREMRIPVDGTVSKSGTQAQIAAQAVLFGEPVRITGSFDSATGDMDVIAKAETLESAALLAGASSQEGGQGGPVLVRGQLGAQVHYVRTNGKNAVTVTAEPRDVWFQAEVAGHTVSAQHVAMRVSATLGDAWEVSEAQADGTVGALHVDGVRVQNVEVAAAKVGREVGLQVGGMVQVPGDVLPPIELSVSADGTTSGGGSGGSLLPLEVNRLRVATGKVDLAVGGANLRGVQSVLNARGVVASDQTRLLLMPESFIGCDAAEIALGGGAPRRTAPMRWVLGTVQDRALVSISRGERGTATTMALAASPEQPLAFDAGGVSVKLGQSEIVATAALGAVAAPQARVQLNVEHGAIGYAAAKVAASDVSAQIPVTLGLGAGATRVVEQGTFTVAGISLADGPLPAVTGKLRLGTEGLSFDASWPVLKGASVAASGDVGLSGGLPTGQIRFSLPRTNVTDEQALARLWPKVGDLVATGTFALDGTVQINGAKLTPQIRLTADNAHLGSASYEMTVDGVSGSVLLDSFSPLSTPGAQRVTVRQAKVGKWDVSDGLVQFRLENLQSILVEQTTWAWAGGRIYTYAVRFDPSKPRAQLVVYGDELHLKQLLPLFSGGEATGDGVVYGRLPVTIDWPRLQFGSGFVYAVPGGGSVQLGGQSLSAVGDLAIAAAAQPGEPPSIQQQLKERMLNALKDFQFDTLKVDFKHEGGGLVAVVNVHGKGRVGPNPQELYLTINARGLDQLLNEVLVVRRNLSSIGSQRQQDGSENP